MNQYKLFYNLKINRIIFLIIFFISIISCQKTPFFEEEIDDKEIEDKIVLKEIEAYAAEVGKPKQKVSAKRAVLYELRQELELEDVIVEFKPDDMSTGTLRAEKGILYLVDNPEKGVEKNDIFLQGKVTYTNLDGIELLGSDIHWNTNKGLFSDNSFYRKIPMGKTIAKFEGAGFSVNSDFTVWTDIGAKVSFEPDK